MQKQILTPYLSTFLLFLILVQLLTPTLSYTNEKKYDAIIVGTGLAGFSAAIQCAENNPSLKILMIEKEKTVGGNSAKSSSGMNAAQTPIQQEYNITDSYDLFYQDTMRSSSNKSIPYLLNKLTRDSTSAWAFLTGHGVDLSALTILGGHTVARSHRPKNGPLGATIIKTLHEYVLKNLTNTIEIQMQTEVIELITEMHKPQNENDKTQKEQHAMKKVIGVKVRNQENDNAIYLSSSVILATGGFGHDHEKDSLLLEFRPDLQQIPTTNGPFATGQGVKMARSIGAALLHMDKVQLHPTGLVDPKDPYAMTKFLGPELLRGSGGILLNKLGKRFCNELGYRSYVSQKIFENAPKSDIVKQSIVSVVFNEEAAQKFGKTLQTYIGKGLIFKVENGLALAKKLNFPPENLKQTLADYNAFAAKGEDIFGKKVFPVKNYNFQEAFYYGEVTPSIHYTMGGLMINKDGAVLSKDPKKNSTYTVISRLFAAGEVAGGVHGENRLGGNSILECVVFGRITGNYAAYLADKDQRLVLKDLNNQNNKQKKIDL